MNIELKNKFLHFEDYKLRCAIGKRRITSTKREGDQKTPRGTFVFKSIFYRKDKSIKLKSFLKTNVIEKNMGWCDDSSSKYYNKLVKFPFKKSAEKLWLKKGIYDVFIVIDYNLDPVVKNKGSAIFLHIAKKNYLPTKGCVAISKKDILFLISKINKKAKVKIF